VSVTVTERRQLKGRTAARLPSSMLWLTAVLAVVLVAATSLGLLVDGMYRETPARELLGATLRGQDLLTLLTVPVLLAAALRARRGSLRAYLVWLGVLLYVPYTYLMYVAVPYNDAFLLYVAAIGIGGYLFLNGLLRVDVHALEGTFAHVPRRGVGWFLVITGAVFATMWLGQNLAVLPGGIPDGLFVYDLPSVVHVLDLTWILPMVIGAGVLLLWGHPAGPVLAAIMLVKMVTLGLALLSMNLGVAAAGGRVDPGETAMWSAIVLVAAAVLAVGHRRLGREPTRWLRPSTW
jgi:hypothetical protein